MKKILAEGLCSTNGKGLWSDHVVKDLPVKLFTHGEFMEDRGTMWGSLHVVFRKKDWNINKHGLIYTDDKFVRDIRKVLKKAGYKHCTKNDIGYSEQGRQGLNYVDFDIGHKLCQEIRSKGFKVKIWSFNND